MKSNSWDPLLEVKKLKEELENSNSQFLDVAPLKCEGKVSV